MRNTTKLKILLQKSTVSFLMNDDESVVLLLTDKSNHSMHNFEGTSNNVVTAKAYSYLLGTLKEGIE
ncbi:MAG TPA: hypothetical protein VE978_03070 [Chitinophagales bacterium]|nr:hypothetical protein [Chitinophagales bacterium]